MDNKISELHSGVNCQAYNGQMLDEKKHKLSTFFSQNLYCIISQLKINCKSVIDSKD